MTEIVAIVALLAILGFFRWPGRSAPDIGGLRRTVRDLQRQLELTQAELDQQRLQVAELAERLDFAERRLVQMQSGKPLPPPSA
jgi:uncharacterized coiled-coil protein SlyX